MKWLRIFMRRKKEHTQYSRGYVPTQESLYAKAQRLYGKDCTHCDGTGYCIDMPCPYCTNGDDEE